VQSPNLTRATLRRLADLRVDNGRVLSVYLNLDPAGFATGAARSSAIRSLVDEADRLARDEDNGLDHDGRKALRSDVDRVREFLSRADLKGAHGMAVFASEPAGLFETVRLSRPVPNEVAVGRSPFVEPIATMVADDAWALLLANRREARIFVGTAERLVEVGHVSDDVHGKHDQGGMAQARYQRSVDNEAMHHLRGSAEELLRRFKAAPFDHLLLGAPEEAYAALEAELHPYLSERLRGRVELDVENSSVEDVQAAAQPAIEGHQRAHQDKLLARLQEGVAAGRKGAAGLAGVLQALNEQRVESLLVDERFSAAGTECLQCGWLGAGQSETVCPADGSELEPRPDVIEQVVERALMQDAELAVLRDRPELGPYGGIAAVLRF